MTIKTKLSQKEYINASLTVIMARPVVRIFLVMFGFVILVNIAINFTKQGASILTVVPMIIVPIIFCVVFYFKLKTAYSNNSRISETITYGFDKTNFNMAGESFKAELSWKKIYKVTLTKKWVLIWQNKQIANAIPKIDLPGSDLDELKDILTANGVKNNL